MSLLGYATQKASPLTLIESSITDLNWSTLGADYVLRGLVRNHKYNHVVVVSFDRPEEDILANAKDLQSKDLNVAKKMSIINALNFDSDNRSLETVHQEVDRICLEHEGGGMIGIMLYSISSACLSRGWVEVKRFLDKLIPYIKGPANERDGHGRGTIICTVHGSLHTRQQLTVLKALADTYCTLTPNSGSLSSSVAVEAHIIRRSTTSTGGVGRVSEAHELFTFETPPVAETSKLRQREGLVRQDLVQEWIPMRLVSLPKVGDGMQKNEDGEEAQGEREFNYGTESVLQTMLDKVITSNNSTASSIHGKQSMTKASVHAAQRLVTFSSTDQEFDEDSDPDADLDL